MRRAARVTLVRIAAFLALSGCTAVPAAARSDRQNFAQIERGRYLVRVADCLACHAGVNGTPFAGGLPIETPFGTLLASNITPDGATGIGNWSDAQFDAALREGRLPDGSRLYPAMPYPYYTRMSRADVLAIRAYLDTVPPVHHEVVSNQLPFPYKMRSLMAAWDALYFKAGEYREDASKSPAWNRGAYLVEGPGHCGACHTPKSWLGGDEVKHEYQGYALQGWYAPDITDNEESGLGRWSPTDIAEYLKRGHNKYSAASGPMREEVMDSSSQWTDQDLAAIAEYLKGLAAQRETSRPLAADNPVVTAGAAIYWDACSGCHKADGTGVPYLFPDIAHASSVAARDPSTLIRVILQGAETAATDEEPTAPQMPAFGWQLTDAQVAALITYIRNSWSHAAPEVTESEVRSARESLALEH
jgi:mono/diheme cytochrome c family protein